MLRVHVDATADAELADTLDELVAEGARRMLAAALEAEVDAYISSQIHEVDDQSRRLVVRNGHALPRSLVTGAGPIEVRAPRVDDRRVDEVTGQKVRFRSAILPPWARKSAKVAEVLPLMYLHGMSSGDFVPALEEFFGSAAALSASVITRLTTDWQKERDQFAHRSLKDVDYVYVYADGIHFNVRLEEPRPCSLVIVGVRSDGTKELVSISDGHRESTESWADVLRGLKRRGMTAQEDGEEASRRGQAQGHGGQEDGEEVELIEAAAENETKFRSRSAVPPLFHQIHSSAQIASSSRRCRKPFDRRDPTGSSSSEH